MLWECAKIVDRGYSVGFANRIRILVKVMCRYLVEVLWLGWGSTVRLYGPWTGCQDVPEFVNSDLSAEKTPSVLTLRFDKTIWGFDGMNTSTALTARICRTVGLPEEMGVRSAPGSV